MRRFPTPRFAPSCRLLVLALALIIGLLASSSARAAKAGHEPFVIVIGHNQSNDKGVQPLRYADDDALRYYELFSLVSKNVALFTVLDDDSARLHPKLARRARPPKLDSIMATLKRYNRQMKALKAKGGRPELVFVYAGHGDIDKSGEGYINLLRAKLRRRDLYRKVLAPSQASYVHLIIDACKSYFLVNRRGWKNDAAKDSHDREIRAFLQKEDLSSYPNAGVILATSGSESTHEWSRYRAGILSHELRSALAGGADINGDGKVEYSEVHAFIAAANARVKNAKARLNIWAKAPSADRHRPLFSVGAARRARLLRFGPQLAGHYHLEDDRGIRAADVNKARGLSFDLALDAHRSYYLRKAGSEARVPAGRKPLVVAQLGFGQPRLAARGSLDATFRRDLYAVAFSRGFYDGFVSRTGHVAVAAATGTGRKLAAAPAVTPAVKDRQGKPGKRPTVAVLYFTYDGTDKELLVLKKGLAELLITDLASLGTVRLVERMRLEAVLGELKLGRSKAIDKRSANRIGKLLGARYLVWGSYFKTFGAFCLTSKVIEVERGLTLPGGKACGKPADFLSLYKKVQTSLAQTLETRLTVASARDPRHRATPRRTAPQRKARAAKLAKRLPVRLTTQTALAYARALDAKDRGDTRVARRELKKLLREQPDFTQAQVLLSSLR